MLAHEPGADEAIVADDITLYFTGKPVTARVTSQSGQVIRFNWVVPKVTDSRGNLVPGMKYRAHLRRGSGTLKVSAEVLGYSARFSGSGRCQPAAEQDRRAFESFVRNGG